MKRDSKEALYYVIMNGAGRFYVTCVKVDDPFKGLFGGAFGDDGGSVRCVFSERLRQALVFRDRGRCERRLVEVERETGEVMSVAGVTVRDIVEEIGKEFVR